MTDQINVTENELEDGTKQKLIVVMRNAYDDVESKMSFGDTLADQVALFGGSWTFIICAVIFLVTWAILNVIIFKPGFDPYPFIFLNLLLSMIAALQAPIIMMSQNRQAAKDRATAQADFEINCKAEANILKVLNTLESVTENLNDKIDSLAAQVNKKTAETLKFSSVSPRSITIEMVNKDLDGVKLSLGKNITLPPASLTTMENQTLLKY